MLFNFNFVPSYFVNRKIYIKLAVLDMKGKFLLRILFSNGNMSYFMLGKKPCNQGSVITCHWLFLWNYQKKIVKCERLFNSTTVRYCTSIAVSTRILSHFRPAIFQVCLLIYSHCHVTNNHVILYCLENIYSF